MKTRVKGKLTKAIMKTLRLKPVIVGIPVIITNNKKEILLGKRSKNSYFYPDLWGLPGGMLEYNEKLEQGAKREVSEELGVEIQIIKQSTKSYENLPTKDCRLHSVDIPFYAKIISGKPKPKDETSEVKWFKPSEIKKMKLAYTHKEILKKEGLLK